MTRPLALSLSGGRVHRLTRQLASVVVPALLIATLGCQEDAESPTAPDESTPALATPAGALAFTQMSVGSTHTCGVTTDNRAYCWGLNYFGQLGDGRFGASEITRPVAAAAARQFLEVRVGTNFTCGLTTENRVYCWGLNTEGQLGNGSNSSDRLEPGPLAGGRRFRLLRVGASHGCANTLSDVTFCWGLNAYGQLGDGTKTNRRSPVKVAGGITFRRLSAGGSHTCGVTSANKAYCWGQNTYGQLGNRSSTTRLTPVAVSDGRAFNVVSAGAAHTCGVTTEHKAFCWGWNQLGQLGDGTTSRRSRPTAVAGGMPFNGVSPGGAHSCGVTPGNVIYCWGWNYYGQVGDGTDGNTPPYATKRLTPVAVAGGLLFNAVVASASSYTCGVRLGGRGYCWGLNIGGYLGDGTTTNRSSPVPVAAAP